MRKVYGLGRLVTVDKVRSGFVRVDATFFREYFRSISRSSFEL
jgi:hypothetical protein